MTSWTKPILAGAVSLCLVAGAHAADDVVARVNGAAITEADLTNAEGELGEQLQRVPEEQRRRVLVEFVIETQLMANAAVSENLDEDEVLAERMKYLRRWALRDLYFERHVTDAITEDEARELYDERIGKVEPQAEIKARHIMVETEAEAREVIEKLAHGSDFAELAKEVSKDPGSAERGGDLGYFSAGRMVAEFEEAAFALEIGGISEPVESQFGWHVIQVEDKREQELASFDSVKTQLMAALVQQKMRAVLQDLREDADVEIVDAEIKEAIESQAESDGEQ